MKRAALLVVLLTAVALAAEPDLSSPKAAAKALFNAITTGDREAVRASLFAADDPQREYVAAMADLIVAGKKLGDVAKSRFGPAGAALGAGTLDPADAARLDQAAVEQSGDAAKLTVPGQPRPMSFRRSQSGNWGLVVTDFADAPAQNIARQTKLVRMMAEAMETSAADIQSEKYKTAEAATTAIQQRLHGVMLQFHRPSTTRSATAPATTSTSTGR